MNPTHTKSSIRIASLVSILLGMASSFTAPANADDLIQIDSDSQLWASMIVQGQVTDEVRAMVEVQPRFSQNMSKPGTFVVFPSMAYLVAPNTLLWIGYARFDAFDGAKADESRFWEQVTYDTTWESLRITLRERLEERLLQDKSEFSYRLRSMLQGSIPLDPEKALSLVASDEVFWTLNSAPGYPKAGFDENRAFAGVDYRLFPGMNVTLGYMSQFVYRPEARSQLNHNLILMDRFSF